MTVTLSLKGRRAIVVGAGGIGSAIVQALAQAQARVVVLDRHDEASRSAAACDLENVIAGTCDASSEPALESAIEKAQEQLGGLDILVYNAGIGQPPGSTQNQSIEMWQKVMDINLKGAFVAARHVSRTFRKQRSGAMVNIASVVGLNGYPGSNAYGVAKAGLVMLTRTLATDLARWGIRVNCVCPGMIRTPLSSELARHVQGGEDLFVRRIPMGRLGLPDEVASAVQFLVSDRSSYITGAVIPVDGGWTAFGAAGDAHLPTR